MLLVKKLENMGDLSGQIMDFEFAGDILPMHSHDEITNHITIVARGRIKVINGDWVDEVVAGQIVDFKVGRPHEFIALEDNSRIINIVKKIAA